MVELARTTSILVATMALAGAAHAAGAPGKKGAKAGAPAAEKVVDHGTFVVTVAGRRAGQEAFSIVEIGREREIRTTTVLGGGKGPTRLRGTLRTDERWQPLRGQFDLQALGGNKRMILARAGEHPELVTTTGARSIMKTQPRRASDLFLLNQDTVVAHLSPLCQLAGAREQTLTAFPAAPLRISPVTVRPYPQTRAGAPLLELRAVVVDVAQSTRFELVCDGPRLLAVHQRGRQLTAVRASYEAVASTLDARAADKPDVPESLVELARAVAVPGGGGQPAAKLSCVLTVPRSHAEVKRVRGHGPGSPKETIAPAVTPLPGVLLLGDAGIQDRDGDPVGPGDPNLSLLKRLAIRLGEGGVSSLRCDDRGVARAGATAQPGLPALAADARALAAALRNEPGVDRARIGILGQGEGGLVAALVADRDPTLRAIGLLATAGRPLDGVVLEQSEATLRRFGYPEAEIAAAVAEQKATYEALRRGTALPATLSAAERRALLAARPWLRSHLATDPAAVVRRLATVPVLLLQGGKDARVSTVDFEGLRLALVNAGNKRVTARFHPDLTHPFAPAKSGSLSDYLDPRAQVSEAVLGDVATFLREAFSADHPLAATTAAAPPAPAPPPGATPPAR